MARGSQPPRPAPRPSKAPGRGAAKGGAARGGAKGTAAKGGAKTGGARKAQPAKAMPRGVRQPAARGATAEQLRQQRLMMDQQRRQREARWWAINQHAMKDLHSRQHHAAGGEAIGTILNADRRMRWRTSRAIGAITLLILAFFFTSMAIGAQSMGIAVLAFVCLAGCIAFFTVEHSARRFPQPVPAPPLIGQHRLEDLIVEDDPPRPAAAKAPGTMEALDDLFEPAPQPEAETRPGPEPVRPAASAAPEAKAPEASIPEPVATSETVAPEAESRAAEAAPAEPERAAPEAIAPEPPRPDEVPATVAAEQTAPPRLTEPVRPLGDTDPEPELVRPFTAVPERVWPIAEPETEPEHEAEPGSEPPAASSAVAESAPRPADPPVAGAFTLPTEQVGGDEVTVAPKTDETPPAKGPIAEAVTRLKSPTPPRPRDSAEGRSLAEDLAALLLSEQRLGGTDVTDVAATLVVADLQRSVEFYTDALGLQVADQTDEAAVLDAGFGKILLWERPDAPPGETGVMHLTFEVGDIDATFAEMNEAGVEFLHLPRTALLGKNYQMRAAAFRDPDGHGLAITEHRERD
ncbi:glyoxalase/bleomycin resistance/dioxygenase family protein [Glycomyces harbinensis]|uniref:Catechol 2,3-dioxygenase n=1 Tax=Glycomyces harbinensis TaxID=58114 RepID=A0A1G7BNK5_9ACTN|nr:glyoxalase/bleomycin resistance/dioxygenase family protein [Glycomyces harbinensis]SDE28708.1 Catechol 2,3-dioxygenase [Glycomyces harbinensis]